MAMLEYKYGNNELSKTIFKERYALHDEETFEEACMRLAKAATSVESPNKIKEWEEKFYEELVSCRFVPGGRIWYGCGRPKSTLLNCFVLGTEGLDSREGWGSIISDGIIIGGTGGGVGINYSHIRPRGSAIRGTGGKSTGSVSLMRIVNTAAEVIEGGGGRRSAHMALLSITHPDLIEFINSKLDDTSLNMMNISVAFDKISPEEFFEMVDNNEKYNLVWKDEIAREVKAKDVWNLTMKNFLHKGEPGILNLHYANQMNSMAYRGEIIGTNPCGEVIGMNNNVCCLGSLVLPNFMKRTNVDLNQLDVTIRRSVRFLDNILDITEYPTRAIAEEAKNVRKIGLGITGLHDLLLMRGSRYGSDESLEFVDKLMQFVRNKSYETSTYVANEKGSFPSFKADEYLSYGFSKTLKPSLRSKIKEFGLRNATLNTIAPNGTISMLVGSCSSGCEPIFGAAYSSKRWRKESENEKDHEIVEEIVFNPMFDDAMLKEQDVSHFQSVDDVTIEEHFKMQHTLQKNIDQSISKTILLQKSPGGNIVKSNVFYECFKQYFPQLKGVTVYVQGSRENEPIVPFSTADAIKLWHKNKKNGERILESKSLSSCKDGKCDL